MPLIVSSKKAKKGSQQKAKAKRVLRFTKEELNENIDTLLTTYNPYLSENCIEFDQKTRIFKPVFDYRKPIIVYRQKGSLRKKLPEAIKILNAEAEKDDFVEEKMYNKFNFRSMATQTPDINPTESGTQIDSSEFPVLKFSATASKAGITAAYEHHKKKKTEEDEYAWMHKVSKKLSSYVGRKATKLQDSHCKFLRLCEKIIDQNLSQANLDFTYYDNPNDEFCPEFGSLLPMWSFCCAPVKGLPVTGIAWNKHFVDMFAVSFRSLKETGEHDKDDLGFMRETGCICVYSLKCTAYPEKVIWCPSAVRTLSFHPKWPHLLATGCENAVICVYDLRRDETDPAGISDLTNKVLHEDAVCKLIWLPDPLPQKFCTVSPDGKVLSWLFSMNNLFPSDEIISLNVSELPGEVPLKGMEMHGFEVGEAPYDMGMKMIGTSMSVNPTIQSTFVVGTEAGIMYQGTFDARSLQHHFEGHKCPALMVHWNPYHPRVFLSCSEDMTVRIWDHTLSECVFEFFFDFNVHDACWAPFSSTLFAAISGNALVYVFDLSMDKTEAVGNYAVHTPKEVVKLTSVCFHPSRPVLMVGNNKGQVHAFKMSPNLRSSLKAREALDESSFIAGEVQKMEKLLAPSKGRPKKK